MFYGEILSRRFVSSPILIIAPAHLFTDVNANKVYDGSDVPFANKRIVIALPAVSPEVVPSRLCFTFTDSEGRYSVICPALVAGTEYLVLNQSRWGNELAQSQASSTGGSSLDVPIDQGTITAQAALVPPSSATISGTGTPGSVIEVYRNGVLIAQVTALEDGTWSQDDSGLPCGTTRYTVQMLLSDGSVVGPVSAGNVVVSCPTSNVVVPTPGPEPTYVFTGKVYQTGANSLINGTGLPFSNVNVFRDGNLIKQTVITVDGFWEVAPDTGLGCGTHVYTATQLDTTTFHQTGPINCGQVTVTCTLPTTTRSRTATGTKTKTTITTQPAPAPTFSISYVFAGTVYQESGNQATANGTGVPFSNVNLFRNGNLIKQTIVSVGGNWSILDNAGTLSCGANIYTATQLDSSFHLTGPISLGTVVKSCPTTTIKATTSVTTLSKTSSVSQTTVAPTFPVTYVFAGTVYPEAGSQATANGTGLPFSNINIFRNGALVKQTIVSAGGNWTSLDNTGGLVCGINTYSATQLDSSFHLTGPISLGTVVIPCTTTTATTVVVLATATKTSTTATATPAFNASVTLIPPNAVNVTGHGNPGSTINVFRNNALIGQTTILGDGSWSKNDSGLACGTNNYTASLIAPDLSMLGPIVVGFVDVVCFTATTTLAGTGVTTTVESLTTETWSTSETGTATESPTVTMTETTTTTP